LLLLLLMQFFFVLEQFSLEFLVTVLLVEVPSLQLLLLLLQLLLRFLVISVGRGGWRRGKRSVNTFRSVDAGAR
jgi:hypothetical protein